MRQVTSKFTLEGLTVARGTPHEFFIPVPMKRMSTQKTILFFVIARLLYFVDYINSSTLGLEVINLIMVWGVINFSLFVFNLIPLPPLDGSHIYLTYIKDINQKLMMNMYKYGTLILLAIIIAESQLKINILHISELVGGITSFFIKLLAFNQFVSKFALAKKAPN